MIESHIRRDGVIVCTPSGELDWINSVPLRHLFHDRLTPEARVIVDLKRVASVDAVGLSSLVGGIRRARSLGATVRIRNPRPPVRRQIELIGLDPFMGFEAPTEADGHDAA